MPLARDARARAATRPESIKTDAKVQILKEGDGFAIKKITLVTVGRVPGIDDAAFQEAAEAAKAGCPISKALARGAGDHRSTLGWRASRRALAGSSGSAGPVSARLSAHSATPSASRPPA